MDQIFWCYSGRSLFQRGVTALVMEVFLKHFYEVSGQKIIGLSDVVGL